MQQSEPVVAAATAQAQPEPAAVSIAERRNGDRRAIAREPTRDGALLDSREELQQRISEHLVADDGSVRTGGVLLLVADDSASHNAAADATLHDEIGRFLNAQTAANEYVALNAPGQFLLFDPDRDTRLLGAWALTLRERIAHAPFGSTEAPRYALFDIGVCPFNLGIHDAGAMAIAARNAIDAARVDGRHGVFVAHSHHAPVNVALVERIRFALDTNGFEVLFQPIVSLQGDETGQFQALLRLRDDTHVLHTAAEVIPAATQAGLIEAVDRWVLAHCIALLGRHADRAHRPRLFVSQSRASLRDAQASTRLRALLAEHGVAASAIVIDLHSADVAHAPAEMSHYSAAMQAVGAGLALSGFNDARDATLLDALRPGLVKLEPDLLRADDAEAREQLRARIDALHEQGVRVIAPRVEDARGAAALCSAGIDFIQGNFVQAADSGFAFDFQESVM
jgi:EAL domain-containing protein (putative c-di-GMP-specific phosphodiesterase class I)